MDIKTSKDMKNMVAAILKLENINYDSWLYEKHLECLGHHSGLIVKALQKEPVKTEQLKPESVKTEFIHNTSN